MAERARILVEELSELEPLLPEGQSLAPVERFRADERPTQHPSPREVAVLIVLSGLLHGGAALGFLSQEKAPREVRNSRVEIEFSRPPEPEKPKEVQPPPPPPPVLEKIKPVERLEAPPVEAQPEAADNPAPSSEVPLDTGSSAESAPDGNLFAGKGGSGLAPVAPPAPVRPPAPAPIIQAHEGANYSKNPRPAYPGRAKREGWEGKVLLRVQVQPNGRPGVMKVQATSGREQLDEAALAAVKGWSFVPARQDGVPVAGWVTVPIVFRLQ